MLTFNIDEIVTPDGIKKEKITDTVLIERLVEGTDIKKIISENKFRRMLDDYAYEDISKIRIQSLICDSKSGITARLYKYDTRFKANNSDKMWKYNLMKLKKMIFDNFYFDENLQFTIWALMEKASFLNLYSQGHFLASEHGKYFDSLETQTKTAMDCQYGFNEPDYCSQVKVSYNNFYEHMECLTNAAKRLHTVDKEMFDEKYVKTVTNELDFIYETMLSEYIKTDDTVFGIFFNIIYAKRKSGENHSQRYINNKLLKIIDNIELPTVSAEILGKMMEYNMACTYLDAGEYISKNIDKMSELIFANSTITVDDGRKKLLKNLVKITQTFNFINTETRYNRHEQHIENSEKRILPIIAMCSAMFVPVLNKKTKKEKPLFDYVFTSDGYYPELKEKERIGLISKDVRKYNNDESGAKEFSSRIGMEIINLYIVVWGNKLDYFKNRLTLENKIDEFCENLGCFFDYKVFDEFFSKYYPRLLKVVLPTDFLVELVRTKSPSVIDDAFEIIIDAGFEDLLRGLIFEDYFSTNQNVLYSCKTFLKRAMKDSGFEYKANGDSYNVQIQTNSNGNMNMCATRISNK